MEKHMRLAKAIALIGVFAMTGILVYAFTSGNFSEEGSKLLAMPWGIVSLVEVEAVIRAAHGALAYGGLALYTPSLPCKPAAAIGDNFGWESRLYHEHTIRKSCGCYRGQPRAGKGYCRFVRT